MQEQISNQEKKQANESEQAVDIQPTVAHSKAVKVVDAHEPLNKSRSK